MYCAVIDATHIYEVYVDTLALYHEPLGVHCNIFDYEHTVAIQNLVYELIQVVSQYVPSCPIKIVPDERPKSSD